MATMDSSYSKNLPAPKTFAPSREDVLSTLGFFFGDPAVPEKLKDYSEHRTHSALHTHCLDAPNVTLADRALCAVLDRRCDDLPLS